jgi:hypothetical protein
VTGGWRKLITRSFVIVLFVQFEQMRWAGHVVRMKEKRNAYWWENQKEGDL